MKDEESHILRNKWGSKPEYSFVEQQNTRGLHAGGGRGNNMAGNTHREAVSNFIVLLFLMITDRIFSYGYRLNIFDGIYKTR